jgi:general L-amino acid transport system permease protein
MPHTNPGAAAACSARRPPNTAALVGVLVQAAVVGLAAYLAWTLLRTTQANLEARNIASGFGFLSVEGGLPINDTLLPYHPSDTYGYAFLLGVLNTLWVSGLSIVLASLLGVVVGCARVSSNWLVSRLAGVYVETLRNVPLLLILFLTYSLVLAGLPHPRRSLNPLPGIFLNNRGIFLPEPVPLAGFWIALGVLGAAVAATWLVLRTSRRRRDRTGVGLPTGWIGLGLIVGLPGLALLLGPRAMDFNLAALKGFNFQGGMVLRPEFSALVAGLVLYTAAFIAENVRSGIQSVRKGQIDAAKALGLKPGLTMRRIVLPQALRVCIPATTNDFCSLVKNSSLAVAIGYPDMVSVGGTIIGQNDQAIEIIGLWMAVYLTINLLLSLLMNRANARAQIVER